MRKRPETEGLIVGEHVKLKDLRRPGCMETGSLNELRCEQSSHTHKFKVKTSTKVGEIERVSVGHQNHESHVQPNLFCGSCVTTFPYGWEEIRQHLQDIQNGTPRQKMQKALRRAHEEERGKRHARVAIQLMRKNP